MHEEAGRQRRPGRLDPAQAEAIEGAVDPAELAEAAHTAAQVLVHRGRASQDPAVVALVSRALTGRPCPRRQR